MEYIHVSYTYFSLKKGLGLELSILHKRIVGYYVETCGGLSSAEVTVGLDCLSKLNNTVMLCLGRESKYQTLLSPYHIHLKLANLHYSSSWPWYHLHILFNKSSILFLGEYSLISLHMRESKIETSSLAVTWKKRVTSAEACHRTRMAGDSFMLGLKIAEAGKLVFSR